MKKYLIIVLVALPLLGCGLSEPHGPFHSKNALGYDIVVIDFYDVDVIRVFAIKDNELYLSYGHWQRTATDNILIEASKTEVSDYLLSNANYYLKPFIQHDFTQFETMNLTVEVAVQSTDLLNIAGTDKLLKAVPLSMYEK